MHFFYLDESGCNGEKLDDESQPIFVLGGISVRDKGWNDTQQDILEIFKNYFGGSIPSSFELHATELLSKKGHGMFFKGHDLDKRLDLVREILALLEIRKHSVHLIAIDKKKLQMHAPLSEVSFKEKTPYLLAYDYLLTYINFYITDTGRGRSARAMLIIDEKREFHDEIFQISLARRNEGPETHRIKHIVEFTQPIDSKKNPMIQISDLIAYCANKFYEIDSEYETKLPDHIVQFYAECFDKIYSRIDKKEIVKRSGRKMDDLNNCLDAVRIVPSRGWKQKYGVNK